MSSRSRRRRRSAAAPAVLVLVAALVAADTRAVRAGAQRLARAPANVLRVCADPNNLPFSNARGEGFENRIAEIVARDLGKRVAYTWWPQRRGFVRNTLNARACDVIIGIPSSVEMVLATRPYYRSTYVFVTRQGGPRVTSFDDPQLRRLKIGVQLVGDDGANSPPVHALTNRGIVGNLVGYMVYGDYARENPPTQVVEAVIRREVDLSIAWGPLAGWVAKRSATPLELTPVSPQIDVPFLPFVYDIAMGVRRTDAPLADSLNVVLRRRRAEIARVLDEFGVPRPTGDGRGTR